MDDVSPNKLNDLIQKIEKEMATLPYLCMTSIGVSTVYGTLTFARGQERWCLYIGDGKTSTENRIINRSVKAKLAALEKIPALLEQMKMNYMENMCTVRRAIEIGESILIMLAEPENG